MALFSGKNMHMSKIRRTATVIAVTIFAEYMLNIVLYPLFGQFSGSPKGSFKYEFVNMMLYIAMFVPPFVIMSKICGWKLSDLNGHGRPDSRVYVMTICLTVGWNFAASVMAAYIESGLNIIGFTEGGSDYNAPIGVSAALIMFLSTAIVPPIVEELSVRGFFLRLGMENMSIWWSVLLTSFTFWIIHQSITIMPLAFGFGIIGGMVRVKYNSLLPSMAGHFCVNSMYLVINQAMLSLEGIQAAVFGAVLTVIEIICLIIGIFMALKMGFFASVSDYIKQSRGQSIKLFAGGVLTSIPYLALIAFSVYRTVVSLEIFA